MIFGWDISTSIIGVAIFSDDGKPVAFHKIDLRKIENMQEKYRITAERIGEMIGSMMFFRFGSKTDEKNSHFIEDRLGGFTRGFTNQNTLLKLAMMNAVVTFILSTNPYTESVKHISPVSVKKIVGLKVPKGGDKKKFAVDFARSYDLFPYELKKGGKTPKDGVTDMADALLLAVAGLNLKKKESSVE